MAKKKFFLHFMQNKFGFLIFFRYICNEVEKKKKSATLYKKIIIIKKVAIKIWICQKRLLYLKCERVETNK
jgi:hypothetical protein